MSDLDLQYPQKLQLDNESNLTLYNTSRYLTTLGKKPFGNIVEKEKMLVTRIFSFSTSFSTLTNNTFSFSATMSLSSANAFNLDQSKILLFGKGLIILHQVLPDNKILDWSN